MADPLEAYNKEIQRRSGPFGLDPAQTKGGAALQFPLEVVEGLGQVLPFIQDTMQDAGAGIINYFKSPSSFVEDVRSGKIPESEIPLGTDLVDIFGDTDPTLGAPDFVTNDYNVGEIFKFDPTGEGKTKGMPETKADREGREAKEQLDAEIQAALDGQFDQVAAQKEKDAQRAEDFRKKEAQIADMAGQGSYNQSIDTIADSEQMFASAMQDFIEGARGAGPDTKEMSIEDYKKEFAEATGIDISGKPDKSQALMAFGLALMQNKAGGKGITGMLGAIGEAGQAALPALEKAKSEARTAALAGGKYALQTRSTDRATDTANKEKMMNRGKYWVYKKGGKGKEFENFDEGQFVDLNKFELNELANNADFDKEYEFISGSDRLSILEKRAETVDLGDQWGSFERISLIGGKADEVPPELQVLAAPADANYKGTTLTGFKLAEKPETIARRFIEYQDSINSGSQKFEVLIANLNEGVSIPKQILSGMQQALRNFGVDAGDMPSEIADAKRMLSNLAIDEATNILKESGKTLSDRDRELVKDRIGKISWTSGDVELIKKQLEEIYDLTVMKPQRNLDRAVSWLEDNAGIKFGGGVSEMPTQKELDAMNKVYGTSLTLDDFKK
tara:strand:- start:46 stop:1899 length:1854 start_codon:yes stop_codon:yes gene_type:complete